MYFGLAKIDSTLFSESYSEEDGISNVEARWESAGNNHSHNVERNKVDDENVSTPDGWKTELKEHEGEHEKENTHQAATM